MAGFATLFAAILRFVIDHKQPMKKCGTTVIADNTNNWSASSDGTQSLKKYLHRQINTTNMEQEKKPIIDCAFSMSCNNSSLLPFA